MEEVAVTSVTMLCSVFTLISVVTILGLCACMKSADTARYVTQNAKKYTHLLFIKNYL